MSLVQEGERQRFEFLRTEYQIVESKWRFFQGLRYAILGGIALAQTSLYALHVSAYAAFLSPGRHGLGRVALIGIPVAAIVIMLVSKQVEQRIRNMYATCSKRGAKIEKEIGVVGIFRILDRVPRSPLVTHTHALIIAFVMLLLMWIALGYFGYIAMEGV